MSAPFGAWRAIAEDLAARIRAAFCARQSCVAGILMIEHGRLRQPLGDLRVDAAQHRSSHCPAPNVGHGIRLNANSGRAGLHFHIRVRINFLILTAALRCKTDDRQNAPACSLHD
ncbi:hypothetical protein [Burkholderia stagnalis]|uniref:hypothetical protein n=1 Tax=Burkholderia stagnalis TaxID=1503054 RepID=UPI000F581145|nr:hypothetical protein [Burkholderia stagnalis]